MTASSGSAASPRSSTETVDGEYQAKLTNDGIDIAKYRAVVQADVIHTKLEDKVVAEVSKPGPQRDVQQIFIARGGRGARGRRDQGPPHPVRAQMTIPPAPQHSMRPTRVGRPPRQEAAAAYERLKADPGLFDSMARAESDEGGALGASGTGGKLPYFDSASPIDEAFRAAIVVPGLEPGELLPPVKSSFGWHVIQVMYFPPDIDQMNALKAEADAGEDFAQLALDNSEDQTAGIRR